MGIGQSACTDATESRKEMMLCQWCQTEPEEVLLRSLTLWMGWQHINLGDIMTDVKGHASEE